MNISDRENTPSSQAQPASAGPGLVIRIVLSLVLCFHLFAVFIYPFRYSTKPSPLAIGFAESPILRWYAEPLYLNHGHGFFGPEPGESIIYIKYEVYDEAGDVIDEGKFPDAERIKPRLLYHRFKMLADQLGSLGPQVELELLKGYARQLIREYQGEQKASRAVVREFALNIPSQAEWEEGQTLEDNSLRVELGTVAQAIVTDPKTPERLNIEFEILDDEGVVIGKDSFLYSESIHSQQPSLKALAEQVNNPEELSDGNGLTIGDILYEYGSELVELYDGSRATTKAGFIEAVPNAEDERYLTEVTVMYVREDTTATELPLPEAVEEIPGDSSEVIMIPN